MKFWGDTALFQIQSNIFPPKANQNIFHLLPCLAYLVASRKSSPAYRDSPLMSDTVGRATLPPRARCSTTPQRRRRCSAAAAAHVSRHPPLPPAGACDAAPSPPRARGQSTCDRDCGAVRGQGARTRPFVAGSHRLFRYVMTGLGQDSQHCC